MSEELYAYKRVHILYFRVIAIEFRVVWLWIRLQTECLLQVKRLSLSGEDAGRVTGSLPSPSTTSSPLMVPAIDRVR